MNKVNPFLYSHILAPYPPVLMQSSITESAKESSCYVNKVSKGIQINADVRKFKLFLLCIYSSIDLYAGDFLYHNYWIMYELNT